MGPITTLLAIFDVLAAPGAISYITKLFTNIKNRLERVYTHEMEKNSVT